MRLFLLLAVVCSVILSSVAALGQSQVSADKFRYIEVSGNKIKTTHTAKYDITVDRGFKLIGQMEHQPVYDKKQFNVSFAAYSKGPNLIMVHAETHTDGTGGLDYSNLKPATLSRLPFTWREQCATPEDDDELGSNPQIQFLRTSGFDMPTPFYMRQLFTTSPDGTAEMVISYGRRIESCDKLTDEFRLSIEKEMAKAVRVKKA